MKTIVTSVSLLASAVVPAIAASEPLHLSLRQSAAGIELSWPSTIAASDGSTLPPYFELQRSLDLQLWQPLGERQRASSLAPEPSLHVTLTLDQPHAFYRLLSVEPSGVAKLGSGGADVFGYDDAFAQELKRIGQISPDQFAAMFPNNANYLPGISWDPTTAQFWDQFGADPDAVNTGKEPDQPGFRSFDARLSALEMGVFKKNGFVVSERLGAMSFAEVFYNLWHNDLPVFISTDALLQAWHRTYDAMLEEIEETYLFNSVRTLLDGMAGQLSAAATEVGGGVLADSLLDADYFLAVARSLLAGQPVPSVWNQDARVAATLADIQSEQPKTVDDFMGFCRVVDFSQFKVRGHYTHTERLGRYFKCVMWIGRIDVPVAGGPWRRCPGVERFTSPRETGFAIVLWHLLNQSGQFATWADLERTIATFVGTTDSLTFGQLNGLLAGAGLRTLSDIPNLATLEKIQTDIVSGQLGVQNIRSDWFEQPLGGAARYSLPQTFTVFGQKFVPDSWAFSQNVFSSILWVDNGETNKVKRRVPGALDVAFSILGNDQVVPELVAQMHGTFDDAGRPHAQTFRDGLPFQHNLAAARAVVDQQTASTWDSNLYMSWLECLRELSVPTTDAKYPEAMRTRAWAMKTLNSQLASWTQLRHDTILYAKQSYTDCGACVYPRGFVEPQLEFWIRFKEMASRAAERLAALHYDGTYPILADGQTNLIDLKAVQSRQVSHLQNFASILERLQILAAKELAQECFNPDDEKFIDGLMEQRQETCGGPIRYNGWYPQLFYRTIYWNDFDFPRNYGAGANDAIVADVHTDVPCDLCGDPGSVLHEAIGHVNLIMVAVDNGGDRFVCAGPVLSHYEIEVIGAPRRLSDEEWGGGAGTPGVAPDGIIDGNFPSDVPSSSIEGLTSPPWTRSYLVPHPQ